LDDDLTLFFGAKGERLQRVLGAGAMPFCWPGLLFPQAWFLYRKMYGWAALVSAGPLVVVYLPHLGFLAWAAALPGALGLTFYFDAAQRTIRDIRAQEPDEDAARALIARAGGVSRIGGAVGFVYAFASFVVTLKAGAG
jgi:hypothetical protein